MEYDQFGLVDVVDVSCGNPSALVVASPPAWNFMGMKGVCPCVITNWRLMIIITNRHINISGVFAATVKGASSLKCDIIRPRCCIIMGGVLQSAVNNTVVVKVPLPAIDMTCGFVSELYFKRHAIILYIEIRFGIPVQYDLVKDSPIIIYCLDSHIIVLYIKIGIMIFFGCEIGSFIFDTFFII